MAMRLRWLIGGSLCAVVFTLLAAQTAPTIFPITDIPPPKKVSVPKGTFRVLHPIERIAYSNDWRPATQRSVLLNAHAFVILDVAGKRCGDLISSRPGVTFHTFIPTKIESPSSEKGRVGTFYEALVPRNAVTCGLSDYVFAEWKVRRDGMIVFSSEEEKVTVEVRTTGTFKGAKRSLFVGLTNSHLWRAHCATYCPREAALGSAYASLLRAHHIQPIQSWAIFPPIADGRLDLDAKGAEGLSFRHLVMGMQDKWVGFPRARHYPDKVTYLKALDRTIQEENLIGRAWVYVWDEPRDMKSLINELHLYRTHAPNVLTMVTTTFDPKLSKLVDIFSPVINHLGRKGRPGPKAYENHRLWPYASCMGSCGPSRMAKPDAPRLPGPETGLPDFLIDRPAGRLFAYFRELEEIGSGAGLYYEATEGYKLVPLGVRLFNDPWNFGGNGDGLLVYPGRPPEFGLNEDMALPSFRLKLIRHAIEAYWPR